MNSSAAAILCDPRPSEHIVYSYIGENQVTEAVTLFTSSGLKKNEAVLLVVTPEHAQSIRKRLRNEGFDVDELELSGQLAFANAEELLATFMFDGIIDEDRFKTIIGSRIETASKQGGHDRPVRVFGEMVDLIWVSNPKATLRLEELWNEVIESYSVPLLCAYSIGASRLNSLPARLLACHSRVLSIAHAEHTCPNCGSTNLVAIDPKAIADELLECRSCKRLCEVQYGADGAVRLVQV
jgi:DcmR-like sensory protein